MMDYLVKNLKEAILMLFSLDREVLSISLVSLKVAAASTLLSTMFGVSTGFLIATNRFFGKRFVEISLNTLMALPTVVVGLMVYSFISKRGILGQSGLLYTPFAMVIGQFILATPIICGLTVSSLSNIDERIRKTSLTLGASKLYSSLTLIKESSSGIWAAIIAGFGRVFSEIGISMMLGGNIKNYTRNIPTAIALETSKGNFSLGLALGIVLLTIAFLVSLVFQYLRKRDETL